MNTRAKRGSGSVKSHFSANKLIKSALFLWTVPSHQSPQFPVICTVTTLTHTGYMFLQHPSPETSFVALFISAFWLFVCWKPVWLPWYSCNWSEGCFCSFCNYTYLCVFMLKKFRSKQVLDKFKSFFLPEGVHLTISARGNKKDRIFTNTLCIIATDTSRKFFLQSMTLSSKCHIFSQTHSQRKD